MRADFFSRRLIFYEDIFSFDGSWYGLGEEDTHAVPKGTDDGGLTPYQAQDPLLSPVRGKKPGYLISIPKGMRRDCIFPLTGG